MSDEIKVKVIDFAKRRHFMLCYVCPLSGRRKWRSSKVERGDSKKVRAAAERAAGEWEKQLNDGTYQPPSRMTWEAFRERYETELLPSLADGTARVVNTVFNSVEEILAPTKLAELTSERLSYYQSELRTGQRAEATIRSYLAHLKASLSWAVDLGLLRVMPKIKKPQRAKGGKIMKGRAIKLEEFERMLAKVPAVVGEPAAPQWKFYLRGLWTSGLRLAESLELYWDRTDRLCVDLSGKRPMLRIRAELEKGNQDRTLAMAPEFAEFLQAVPGADRHGRVFKVVGDFCGDWVSRTVSAIGEKAGVKVNTTTKGDKVITKYASAHDLRRAFGTRWSRRVMPQVLMELMRHESMETTLKYYVDSQAQDTADLLWAAHERDSNSFSNSDQKSTGADATADDAKASVA